LWLGFFHLIESRPSKILSVPELHTNAQAIVSPLDVPGLIVGMKGFTQLSEKLGPGESFSLMYQVFEIHDYEGTVNEPEDEDFLEGLQMGLTKLMEKVIAAPGCN
jgi:hypothetical protein